MKFPRLFLLMALLWPFRAQAIPESVSLELSEEYVSGVLELFPEGKEIDPHLLNFQVNPNIHLHRQAKIAVTFLHEGAKFHNSFGYFLYRDQDRDETISGEEILKQEILFPEVVADSEGGTLSTGDTVDLGKFPKETYLGFFLTVHGQGGDEWTFYTIDGLNFDGHRHLAMRVTPDGDNIALGIEDLPWNYSDKDFNDIIFTFTITPKEALQEVIEEGNIPGAPTPAPVFSPAAPENPKKGEPTVPQTAQPEFSLEGGGMSCALSKETEETRALFLRWFGATCLVSLLGIRLLRFL